MSLRPTTYHDVHDEFYNPGGLSSREKRPIRQLGHDMGLRGQRVTREFLDDQAQIYHGRLNSALHTIDQRAHIVRHRAGDGFRNLSLMTLAVGGIIILALALTVDYKILHDFWTTIYQNKFLQVPESLKDNVVFKSLQVLFAVIAIHFLISAPGVFGKAIRGTFMVSIGVMVLAMLIGLGFLAARSTIPAGSTFAGRPVSANEEVKDVSNDDILKGLGLRPSSGASDDEQTSDAKPHARSTRGGIVGMMSGKNSNVVGKMFTAALKDPDSASTVVFFSTFSLIFLFVSSVGALCMHYSLKAIHALFGGVDAQHREHAMPEGALGVAYWALGKGEWRPKTRKDLADERQRILHAQRLIGEPAYRENLMNRHFADFAAGYMDGLHERESSPRRLMGASYEELRNEMRTELAEARGNWSAEEISGRIPGVELRRTLGYDPETGVSSGMFGFLGGRRAVRDGGELQGSDYDDDDRAARLPGPRAA